MKGKSIIVYVCNAEFDDFQGTTRKVDDYRCKVRCDGDVYFIAIRDSCDGRVFAEKQAVRSMLPYNKKTVEFLCSENVLNSLKDKVEKYLETIQRIIKELFQNVSTEMYQSVSLITHWGGGSSTDVDNAEICIEKVRGLIGGNFVGWETWAASETMRPGLFSPEYNTAMARAHKKAAKLPDAKECEKILQRLKDKNYGTPFVDMEETDEKILFYDIMKHLNH